jgi:hypothetical protein
MKDFSQNIVTTGCKNFAKLKVFEKKFYISVHSHNGNKTETSQKLNIFEIVKYKLLLIFITGNE